MRRAAAPRHRVGEVAIGVRARPEALIGEVSVAAGISEAEARVATGKPL